MGRLVPTVANQRNEAGETAVSQDLQRATGSGSGDATGSLVCGSGAREGTAAACTGGSTRKEPRASLESSASADSVGVDLLRYLRGLVARGFTTKKDYFVKLLYEKLGIPCGL